MRANIEALLVEDNWSDAQLFEAIVNSSELGKPKLHHAERFDEAVTVLGKNSFDVVLLDLHLPDGQGLDLIKQLKKLAPQTPIIVLTGLQNQTIATAALQEGAQDYLVKSDTFSPRRLAQLGYVDVGNLLVQRLQYAIERAELTKQLAISQERYALAVEGANDGIWDWDLKNNQVYYSPRWQALLGLHGVGVSDSPDEWLSRIHPQDRKSFDQKFQEHLAGRQQQFYCEYRIRHQDGDYRWMLTRGIALWNSAGIAYRIAGSQTDVTSRKSLEQALYEEKELAQITLHSIGDAVITTDEQGHIKDFNPVAERLTGWQAKEAKHKPIVEVCEIVDGNTRQRLKNPAIRAIEECQAVSLSNHPTLISRTGEEFAIGDSAAPIRSTNGEIVGTVLIFHDVTEERGRSKQLAWQVSHDPLTHLFNRKKFIQCLNDITEESRTKRLHVLCYLDLDHFKVVNDTCGHAAGDKLLKQVADLWLNKIRKSDVLARLGGDEFGLLLYDCDLKSAIKIATSFCNGIQSFRFLYEGKVFNIGVSIGVVPITSKSMSTEQVLRLADAACYTAKNRGRNRVHVYHPEDADIAQQAADTQWFSRITEALDTDQFRLYHQTITAANANSTDTELCEILLRLSNPQTGQITPPTAFIPSAERYDLMPKIDRWVVEHFLDYLSAHPSLLDKIYTINLSGSSVNDDTFVSFLKHQLALHPIEPKQLCFEITETVAISNLQKAADFIIELKKLGCCFALDDFGSGMSSLPYLKQLPVDYLKIDGNLVKEAPIDKVSCAMLESINHIGHVMGLKTIAEYVENQSILEKAQELSIDYVQGYEIAYPQPLMQI
ncbi:MAG: EAL domain-containing protein [Leptolyngbyaceae cyanobacterium MO_188.B28]|nr:EAL domain-containing protein [Leptolyngbyaceae cyanobacterium MO_188.B28]